MTDGLVVAVGGMLIGSHAYGVILNRMGIRSKPYAAEDIGLARREKLAFEQPLDRGLLEILRETGIDFVEVPRLNRKAPSTSFKKAGRSHFRLDLLVPSPDDTYPVVPVPELRARALITLGARTVSGSRKVSTAPPPRGRATMGPWRCRAGFAPACRWPPSAPVHRVR